MDIRSIPGECSVGAAQSAETWTTVRSEEEAVELVRQAASERFAIVPVGGATRLAQGNALRAGRWVAASTLPMNRLVEYSPDDMVVTAQAGMTIAELQAALAAHSQYLPLDPPCGDRATLGGIVATNAHGLWRPAWGTPRDRLLGLRVVMADGEVIRAGGKVVKNVAGYDLCKLFTGSWGTLGLITEVTFKTSPLPPSRRHITFPAPSVRQAVELALKVHEARLQPIYLTACVQGACSLYIGLAGGQEAVAWQAAEITRLLETTGLQAAESAPGEEELRCHAVPGADELAARITALPSELPALSQTLIALAGEGARMAVQVVTGIVELAVPDGRAAARLARELPAVVPPGGHLTWPNVPESIRPVIADASGRRRGDFAIMKRIKQELDPNGIFSPGRFIGRL